MISANLSLILNHLWQSTLFAAGAWLLTLALRKNHADIRYGLWLASSVKFLVPFSLLVSTGSQFGSRTTSLAGALPLARLVERIGVPFTGAAEAVPAVTVTAWSNPIPVILFGIWFCGIAVSGAVWLGLWLRFRAALRSATPLDLDVPIPVMTSPGRLEPGVVGIRKPILLLPEGILDRLTPVQLQAIVAHEICHARRRDNLTAAIHMVVESIFWFHPLVWWIGGRLVEERERVCDEEVMRLGYEPEAYAEGILNVCRFYLQSPLTCAAGVTGANLRKRIEAIVNYRISDRLTRARKVVLAAAAVATVAGPVLVGIMNVPKSRAQSKVGAAPSEITTADMADSHGVVAASARISTQSIRFEGVPEPPRSETPRVSGPTIEAIEFRGTRISQLGLRATIDSRVGRAYDIETLRRDSQALYNTGRFSNVALETEAGPSGVRVRFVVVERPLIQSVEFRGDDTVTMPEILERFKQRRITLRPETLYNEDELPRAAATVNELVTERGRRNIAVTPLTEPAGPPSTVKITFRVEEKK